MMLCCVMRDAHRYLGTWTRQIEGLARRLPLQVTVAEGDSDDETYKELLGIRDAESFPMTVLKVEHGGPMYESVDRPWRWRQLGAVCEVALTAAVRDMRPKDTLAYVESDLQWEPETLVELDRLAREYGAVAPMSMQGARFWDIWGHVKDGERFRPWPPYHPGISPDKLTQIDSAGSCTVFSHAAAQVIHFSTEDCIRGLGRSLAEHGMALWLDPKLKVRHP